MRLKPKIGQKIYQNLHIIPFKKFQSPASHQVGHTRQIKLANILTLCEAQPVACIHLTHCNFKCNQ